MKHWSQNAFLTDVFMENNMDSIEYYLPSWTY